MTIAPFPWFGGKHRVAPLAWAAMGVDVANYVEPFAGSAAVLMARPGEDHGIETINDADGMVTNFWRAVRAAPDAVAEWMEFPVCEHELTARHLWLVARRAEIEERIAVDVDFFDARAAGYWCWGCCAWIGSGWCSGEGPWTTDGERWIDRRSADGAGRGINRKLPYAGDAGRGINRQLPHAGDAGRGINRQLPHAGDAGRGQVADWMHALATRLRRVRVMGGDWRRVLTPSITTRHGTTGIFVDPPYPDGWDVEGAYSGGTAGQVTWHEAAAWCVEAGTDRSLRIVLCGYEGTWAPPGDWRTVPWKARGGHSSRGTEAYANAHRERLWLSPGCLDVADTRGVQASLWERA